MGEKLGGKLSEDEQSKIERSLTRRSSGSRITRRPTLTSLRPRRRRWRTSSSPSSPSSTRAREELLPVARRRRTTTKTSCDNFVLIVSCSIFFSIPLTFKQDIY